MGDTDHPAPSLFALHRIPNGLVVLLTVALLLQGPVGAFEAFWTYTTNLVGTLFGGQDLFWEVLCQAGPLAFAASAIALAYRSGWITFSSPVSLIASAMLVLTGTWGGGELRSLTAKRRPAASPLAKVLPASARGATPVVLSNRSLSESSEDSNEIATISVADAIARWSDVRTTATDGDHHRWTDPVPRVALIPESRTVWGILSRAINQLLGYFVVYRPRLFLAAVLLGSYLGWSWQPYVQTLYAWFSKLRSPAATSGR